MNSNTNTKRTITVAYGPGYANSEVWKKIQSKLIRPTEIVSITAAQRYKPALILLDHHLLRELEYPQWVKEFPESILSVQRVWTKMQTSSSATTYLFARLVNCSRWRATSGWLRLRRLTDRASMTTVSAT